MWNYAGAVPVEARGLGPVRMLTSHWTCAWLWAAVPGGVTAASPQHPGTEGLTTNPAATAVPRVPSLGTAFPGSGCNLARGTLGRWSHPLPPHHPGWAPELWTAPLLVTGGCLCCGGPAPRPQGSEPHLPSRLGPERGGWRRKSYPVTEHPVPIVSWDGDSTPHLLVSCGEGLVEQAISESGGPLCLLRPEPKGAGTKNIDFPSGLPGVVPRGGPPAPTPVPRPGYLWGHRASRYC